MGKARTRTLPGRRLVTRHRLRSAEAMALIVSATVIRRLTPMTKWQGMLGLSQSIKEIPEPMDAGTLTRPHDLEELEIYHSVLGAANRLPYNPRCLDRATAGQLMLRRRHRPGVVVIGLAKPKPAEAKPDEQWKAHAWLVGRTGAVTGGREAIGFVPTSCFIPAELTR